MARCEELTDEQWSLIEPLFDKPSAVATRGRPRRSEREVMNGVLWILRSGARRADLPDRFPPYQTCHRRFQEWVREGKLRLVLETLAADLSVRGKLDLSECFVDGTFACAKKGALKLAKPSGAKVRSSWQWQTALVQPPRRPHRKCCAARSPTGQTNHLCAIYRRATKENDWR